MTTLQVTELNVVLGGRKIVHDVSLTISTGEWLCVIGPNGAGKSTLLRALAGVIPSSGDFNIDNSNVRDLNVRDRACWIAYVAQDPVMPAGMKVFDYVMLGRTAHLRLLASESDLDIDMTNLVLDELNLLGFTHRDVATLSGGERQRVAIARALAQASPIVLLDEPTTALDVGYQQEVLELIDKLRHEQKIAVISTMHDLTVSGLYPDRLMLMAQGRTAKSGTAHEVLTEDTISEHYGAKVRIIEDPRGPIVVPHRENPQ
jgi:iron complex transport system ATP-binding protein